MVDVPFSAEPITIVRIEQPFCENAHGAAPCTADGEPCFNTRSTCQDPENYIAGPTKKLYFGMPGEGRPADDIYIFPLLRSVSTSAARVNVSGADKRASPLGVRARATIQFRDMPHTDRIVDPYLSARSYDPRDRGSFWSKWNERNRFARNGMIVSILEGYAGQALADMTRRVYIADLLGLSGADVGVGKCRDRLLKAEADKAQIPRVSQGELHSDIDATATSIKVAAAVLDDYAAAGTIRINDEVMTYSAVVEDGSGFLDFTITARGSDNTEASDHDAEDQVQQCFRFEGVTVDQGLRTVYEDFTEIPAAFLPFDDWTAEADSHLTAYRLTGLISEPTAVKDIIGEILEQAQAMQWWDERAQEVRFLAVKPIFDPPRDLNEEEHILAGSVKLREFVDRRVSRVYVYFDQRDPTVSVDEGENYRKMQGSVALEMEAPEVFGEPAIRKVYARFVDSAAVALETSARILARYKEGSREITFALSDRDADLNVGEIVFLHLRRIQDASGLVAVKSWIITSREVQHRQRRAVYTAEDATLAGVVSSIAPDTVGDWQGDGSDPFGVLFISDAAGLLPGGAPGFNIN